MPQNKKPNVIVQQRDLQILKELWQCGIMTPRQIATVLFDGNRETAKKRLGKLNRAGLIRSHGQSANRERVLGITEAGARILRSHEIISETVRIPNLPARQNIEHDLAIAEVRLAFHQVEKANTEFNLLKFATYPVALSLPHSASCVRPDAYAEISINGRNRRFFIEVDRGTETRARLMKKFSEYSRLLAVGGRACHRIPTECSFDLQCPFRVLVVCSTKVRATTLISQWHKRTSGGTVFNNQVIQTG